MRILRNESAPFRSCAAGRRNVRPSIRAAANSVRQHLRAAVERQIGVLERDADAAVERLVEALDAVCRQEHDACASASAVRGNCCKEKKKKKKKKNAIAPLAHPQSISSMRRKMPTSALRLMSLSVRFSRNTSASSAGGREGEGDRRRRENPEKKEERRKRTYELAYVAYRHGVFTFHVASNTVVPDAAGQSPFSTVCVMLYSGQPASLTPSANTALATTQAPLVPGPGIPDNQTLRPRVARRA